MSDQLLLALVGMLATAASALSGWALRQVHGLSIEVAVLKRGEGAVSVELRDIKLAIKALEARIDAGLLRHEENARNSLERLEERIDALGGRIEAEPRKRA